MRISLELELHLPFPARNGRSVSQPKKAPRQSNEERRGGEKIINPAESVRYGAAVTHARLFTSKCYCIVRCSNIRTPVLPLRTVLGESSSLEQLLPRENVTNSTSCELCDDATCDPTTLLKSCANCMQPVSKNFIGTVSHPGRCLREVGLDHASCRASRRPWSEFRQAAPVKILPSVRDLLLVL